MNDNAGIFLPQPGNLCFRCMVAGDEDGEALSDLSRAGSRSTKSLLKEMEKSLPGLKKKASQWSQERLEEERQQLLEQAGEQIIRDDLREEVEQQIRDSEYRPDEEVSRQDIEDLLKDYEKQGYISREDGEIKITPKGARKLGRYVLNIIEKKLTARDWRRNSPRRESSPQLALSSRKYELGDEYYRIDFEKTLLNAVARGGASAKIPLTMEDLQIFDDQPETRMCAGLIIDESGSMAGEKINAAMDTALALAELIRKQPQDMLKVYLFSSRVREIPYYDIVNSYHSGDTTDIRAAMKAFRRGVTGERGDKQAYLITDAAANTENGAAVGFSQATAGVMREALNYRQAGITLNVIMLDQSPDLKEVASSLARQNMGRVVFTSPQKLGEVVIEDYLASKKKN